MAPLLLASASPRRTALLRLAGVEHSVAPVDCDERWIAGERAPDYARRIALAKAQLALTRGHPGLILAADTAVWIEPDAAPLGKPTDRQDARDMLRRLFSAGRHHVTTAFALIDGARRGEPSIAAVTTAVWFRELRGAALERCLERYLDGGEWQGKAGAYAIQGEAAAFVRRLEGSYSAVVGLPIAEVLDALDALTPAE